MFFSGRNDAEAEIVNASMISVEDWSPDQVSTWIKHIGFPQYAQSFVGEGIHFHRTAKDFKMKRHYIFLYCTSSSLTFFSLLNLAQSQEGAQSQFSTLKMFGDSLLSLCLQ